MGRTFRTAKQGTDHAYGVEVNVTPTTGSTKESISNHGVTVFTTVSNTYVMAPPVTGCVKYLVAASLTSASTVNRVVKVNPAASSGGPVRIGNAASSFTKITFNSTDLFTVCMVGINSTKWHVLYASTGAFATINTTGVVLGTS